MVYYLCYLAGKSIRFHTSKEVVEMKNKKLKIFLAGPFLPYKEYEDWRDFVKEKALKDIERQQETELKEIEHQKKVAEAEKEKLLKQIDIQIHAALKSGDMEEYARLTLYKLYYGEDKKLTVDDIEKLLEESERFFTMLDKQTYKMNEYRYLKDKLLSIIEKNQQNLQIGEFEMKLLISTLFDKNFKDMLGADIYKQLAEILFEQMREHGVNPASFRFQLPLGKQP